ncbi:Zinc finger MYM-type protein 1, partial [Trachymyrmex cornetzi]
CSMCCVNLRAHHDGLVKHANSKMHRSKMQSVNRNIQKNIENLGIEVINFEAKSIDLLLTMYIATHTSIKSIDHLSELLKILGKGSKLEKLQIHRTKCSMLITNVLAPAILSDLIEDVKESKLGYSLIVDESTDIAVNKFMGICIRYYSKKYKTVMIDFLGFIELKKATAIDLKDALVQYLSQINLDISEMIGLGTDGANVLQLQLVKCVCHSLHLCSSYPGKELPETLEFLIRETRSWFSNSSMRQSLYRDLYAAINDGSIHKKLTPLCKTRWLVWSMAVKSTLEQWLELKTHFIERANDRKENCYMARILRDLYKDDSNMLYLTFLKPVLEQINSVNLFFQSQTAEVTELFEELRVLLMSVACRIIKPAYLHMKHSTNSNVLCMEDLEIVERAVNDNNAWLPIESVDLGESFRRKAHICNLSSEELNLVKTQCASFLLVVCRQIVKRFPANLNLIEAVKYFSPKLCINSLNQPEFHRLPLNLIRKSVDIDILETQWKKLPLISWTKYFNEKVPNNSIEFWSEILQYQNAESKVVFKELAEFVLRVLILPFSNADVERVFSIMNATKTKSRNLLCLKMLEALVRIKISTQVRKQCCNVFKCTQKMYELFTSSMYTNMQNTKYIRKKYNNDNEMLEEAINILVADED